MLLACLALMPRKLMTLPHLTPISIRPEDYQTVAFLALVAIFEVWERFRPARNIDRWADLKIDLLSFSLAILDEPPLHPCRQIHDQRDRSRNFGWRVACAAIAARRRLKSPFRSWWLTLSFTGCTARNIISTCFGARMPGIIRRSILYWFSGFRTSFLHSFMNNIPQAAVPMLVFGLSPFQAGIGYAIAVLIQFWEHTNIRVNIGPLKYVFITPDYHRVHHSATQHCRMNLGGTFSIWDRLFGTYVDPATMPEAFPIGLGEPIDKKKIPRMLIGV